MCFFINTSYANCRHTVRKFCRCLVHIHSDPVRPCGPIADVYLDGAPELDLCLDCRTKRNNEWRAEARDPRYAEERDRYAPENNQEVSEAPAMKQALVPRQDPVGLRGPVRQRPPAPEKRIRKQASIAPPPPPVHKSKTGMSQTSATWSGSGQDEMTHLPQAAVNELGEALKLKEYTPTPIADSRVTSDSPLINQPSFQAVEQSGSAARERDDEYTYSVNPFAGDSQLPWQSTDYPRGSNIYTRQQSMTEDAFEPVDVRRPWLHTLSRQVDDRSVFGSHQQNTDHMFGPAMYPGHATQFRSAENTNNYFDGQTASTLDGGNLDHMPMPEPDMNSRQVGEPFPAEDASLNASPMDSGHTSDQALYSRQTRDSRTDGQQRHHTDSHCGQDGGSESPPVDLTLSSRSFRLSGHSLKSREAF